MKKIVTALVIAALLGTSLPVLAEHRDGHRVGRWEGHEIHRFQDRDLRIWRSGHWVHRRHDGRLGWWWIAAGTWYFYPAPVYPYPDPYTPSVTIINQPPAAAPLAQPQPQSPPPAQMWYYCDSAKAYYPYAASCPEAWRQVPAQSQ